jgi:prepilin-type N-terminal cleavage/methylation domain-containing protein
VRKSRAGFTLVEMLVVIIIIAILAAMTLVGVNAAMIASRSSATETMVQQIKAAVEQYNVQWGDMPPTNFAEISTAKVNDINNGIETLTACLSSQEKGGPRFKLEKSDLYCNTDGDKLNANPNNWYFGTNELFEIADYFGRPLVYFHFKDYAKPSSLIVNYRFVAGEALERAKPLMDPTTKAYVNADKFQVFSAGRDGKPGTADDIR